MITDDMLKEAAGELEAAMMAQLPEETECDHEFSAAFEKKMKKVTYRANHPFAAKFGRQVAAAVLALVLVGGTVLGISPVARASFVGWVKEAYGTAVHYFIPESATENLSEDIPTDYHLGWVPEEYTLLEVLEDPGMIDHIYVDANGVMLRFGYRFRENGSSSHFFVGNAEYTSQTIAFGDGYADLYTKINGNDVGLVWSGYGGNVLFCLAGRMDVDVLLKIAEGVIHWEK